MATNSQVPFNPQGETVAITAAAIAPAAVQVPVFERAQPQETGQVRVVNAGNNVVHLGVGPTAAIAEANAVAAIPGTPSAGIPLLVGAVEILRFSAGSFFTAGGAAATIYITPGEGL